MCEAQAAAANESKKNDLCDKGSATPLWEDGRPGAPRVATAVPRRCDGWLLNALVVGTPGEGLSRIVSDLERDIFFAYPDDLGKWKRIAQGSLYPPPTLTAEETARGYAVFARDCTQKVFPFTHPARYEIDRPITAFATPGEFEPAAAAVYPLRDLGAVEVEVSDFTLDAGGMISRAAV